MPISRVGTLKAKKNKIIRESPLNSDSQNDLVQLEFASKAINEIISPSKQYDSLKFDSENDDEEFKSELVDTSDSLFMESTKDISTSNSQLFQDDKSNAIEFNEEAYKLKMIAEYEQQQQEHHAMLMRKQKEREDSKSSLKSKLRKKRWWKK